MNDRRGGVSPFPPGYRASGVLLHVTSLPCAYGIGDLGPSAFAWVYRLHEAGQRWWQALPVGPTGYSDSPYQCLSSFAGNELLISPDGLIEDGLLRAADCAHDAFSPSTVEYEKVVPFKVRLLETAWSRFGAGARPDLRPAYEQLSGPTPSCSCWAKTTTRRRSRACLPTTSGQTGSSGVTPSTMGALCARADIAGASTAFARCWPRWT
jgi:4-alpha-glucanotransferase